MLFVSRPFVAYVRRRPGEGADQIAGLDSCSSCGTRNRSKSCGNLRINLLGLKAFALRGPFAVVLNQSAVGQGPEIVENVGRFR